MPKNDHCKGCGAEIIWANSRNGKAIPLDAKSEKRFTLVDSVTKQQVTAFLVDTFTSHFATCPKAGEFRKLT